MKRAVWFLVVFGLVAMVHAGSQDLDAYAEEYRAKKAELQKDYDVVLARVREKYTRSLKSARMRLRKPTDRRTLDREVERFEKEKTVPKEPPEFFPKAMVKLCEKYHVDLAKASSRRDKKLRPAASLYYSHLRKIKKEAQASGDTQYADKVTEAMEEVRPLLFRLGALRDAVALVLWNQHNSDSGDRGTRACNLRVLMGKQLVWSRNNVGLTWYPDRDASDTFILPDGLVFDRVKIEIVAWHGSSGGFSEIEVIKNGKNVAKGSPVRASGALAGIGPARVTDGITTSRNRGRGYWCLPNSTPGWVEVDLSDVMGGSMSPLEKAKADRMAREDEDETPSTLSKLKKSADGQEPQGDGLDLVIWNSCHAQRGVTTCDIYLYQRNREVWRKKGVRLPWVMLRPLSARVAIPPELSFDCVRIEITGWRDQGGGLGEIELMEEGKNLARNKRVQVSATGPGQRAKVLTDGDRVTATHKPGWLLPDNTPGWVEVHVRHRGKLKRRKDS